MVNVYKHMRLIMMATCIVAYSCYLYSGEDFSPFEEEEQLSSEETRMLYYIARVYAEMLHHGARESEVYSLITIKYTERPEMRDKVWNKAKEIAALIPSEGSQAFQRPDIK